MKFCKDCKHIMKPELMLSLRFAKCGRKLDLVTGNKENSNYCSLERKYSHLCGPTAKFFEQRENTWWENLIQISPFSNVSSGPNTSTTATEKEPTNTPQFSGPPPFLVGLLVSIVLWAMALCTAAFLFLP